VARNPDPAWYGHRYPTWDDFEALAWDLGATVVKGPVSKGAFFAAGLRPGAPAVVVIPQDYGPLEQIWSLAHELGHLVQHTGPKGKMFHRKSESQANRWAAKALVPEARIMIHQNACTDAIIAALSVHYEDIPFINCPTRRLAAKIAKIRLKILEETIYAY
jgi:hypothetical protein